MEAACVVLELAKLTEMVDAVAGLFEVAVEHGGVGAESEFVGGAVDVEVKTGAFSVHDPFVLHCSSPNRSTRRRCGITIKYIATDVSLDRDYVSPSGFDWHGARLYHARGARGALDYWN